MAQPAPGDRVAVVTGAGNRRGIGFAIARRLLGDGARVLLHTFDAAGPEPGRAALAELGGESERLRQIEADLGGEAAPRQLIEAAIACFGAVDHLIVNHAHSSAQSLAETTAAELERSWAVNVRAAVLLVQTFAERHDDRRGGGRVVLFTSGQHLGPMPGELPYVLAKGAVHQATRTLADELADRGIAVNAVNPGPVDTGWASAELRRRLEPAFPAGRWGRPEDVAAVVAWLLSAESGSVTGQVIDAEGGFRRHLAGG